MKPLEEFITKLSGIGSDNNLYQWGAISEKNSNTRSVKVSAKKIKQYGQVGIGSVARGCNELIGDFIGGGEGFLFDSQNFRITKGDGVFEVKDDQEYWMFQVTDFNNALKISDLSGNIIEGRKNLMEILKDKSRSRLFVATFDVRFNARFFARSNGIFPEDLKFVQNPNKTLFDQDIKGGHLLGGGNNIGDIKSLKEKFNQEEAMSNDFSCQIMSQVLLKPIEEIKIIKNDNLKWLR